MSENRKYIENTIMIVLCLSVSVHSVFANSLKNFHVVKIIVMFIVDDIYEFVFKGGHLLDDAVFRYFDYFLDDFVF